MQKLIESIRPDSLISIRRRPYRVWAQAFYVTEKNPNDRYVKVFLEDHHVLVLSPADKLITFGRDRGALKGIDMDCETFSYEGYAYRAVAADYQIPVGLVFGDPAAVEGEVRFRDYTDESAARLISLGLVTRTQKRADIVAEILDLQDLGA